MSKQATAQFSSLTASTQELIEQKEFSITVPVDSNNYSGYVQAASTTLVHLSKDINLSLQKIRSAP